MLSARKYTTKVNNKLLQKLYFTGISNKLYYNHMILDFEFNFRQLLSHTILYHTKKALYMRVKNKYCILCAQAATSDNVVKENTHMLQKLGHYIELVLHGTSIIADTKMYRIRFACLIVDGDSSVYKKILDCRPYKATMMEEIECKNHLLPNFPNKPSNIHLIQEQYCNAKKVG